MPAESPRPSRNQLCLPVMPGIRVVDDDEISEFPRGKLARPAPASLRPRRVFVAERPAGGAGGSSSSSPGQQIVRVQRATRHHRVVGRRSDANPSRRRAGWLPQAPPIPFRMTPGDSAQPEARPAGAPWNMGLKMQRRSSATPTLAIPDGHGHVAAAVTPGIQRGRRPNMGGDAGHPAPRRAAVWRKLQMRAPQIHLRRPQPPGIHMGARARDHRTPLALSPIHAPCRGADARWRFTSGELSPDSVFSAKSIPP